MNHKSYITIKTTEINTVDFSEVIEQKATLRYSLDGTEFVCKWVEGAPYMPASIEAVPVADRSDIMNQTECLALMATAEWADPNPIP
tara:strand:- start:9784 stop:10044 length:261 start_codon:yes stop_codon:yes gene_type:complete